jgi:4-hydroxy-4-methyl-2-oxoglutarate aldolase
MKIKTLSPQDLALLGTYDTPTVCNVIELFDLRPRTSGYMDGRIQACFPEMPPMVGYAVTATFQAAAPPLGGDVYASMEEQVAAFAHAPGPIVIVFQDLDDPPLAATFGEVMCTTYQAFGAVGLITSGAGRDLDQVQDLNFPAFTNGTICSHGYSHQPSIQVPVRVGGETVYPGQLLHGDCNGVTSIPIEIASEVAHTCQPLVEAEQIVLGYLHGGSVTVKGLSEARGEMANKIGELRAQVARPR